MTDDIDIRENALLAEHPTVLRLLLADHNTRRNIFWATDSYAGMGEGYDFHDQITIEKITGDNGSVIRPRAVKSRDEQDRRVKNMAEVFTPSSICKTMVDAVFDDDIRKTYLEITCGEAPFLASRYDTVTGEPIPLGKRIGILDRKLTLVNATASDADYDQQALLALGSVYGYEWQGDNLFLAREVVITTFAEHYQQRFGNAPDEALMLKAAEIVSWNLWQMDGLKAVVPCSCHAVTTATDLFGNRQSSSTPCPGCATDDIMQHNGIHCRLRRWLPTDKAVPYSIDHFDFKFTDIISKKTKTHHKTKHAMTFDYIIGNPPYQEETKDTSDKPIYDRFMDETYKIGDKVELITPARFLFNAGKTPKAWNEKMLNDKHLKVLMYQQDSSKVFANTDIKGGVAVTYHDKTRDFGAIEVFTNHPELNYIRQKVETSKTFKSFSSIVFTSDAYHFTEKFHEDFPNAKDVLSKGHENDVTSNIFSKLPNVFLTDKPEDGHQYIRIYGLDNAKRCVRWVREDYIKDTVNLKDWKILFSKSNGAGKFGETFAEPIISEPNSGHTQTFISMGAFKTQKEAANLEKYIKTKFARTLLGILKVTQDNKKKVWKYVPLQDFTSSSDIDWSVSIHEVDLQLYAKYGLDAKETAFIESKVKEMA